MAIKLISIQEWLKATKGKYPGAFKVFEKSLKNTQGYFTPEYVLKNIKKDQCKQALQKYVKENVKMILSDDVFVTLEKLFAELEKMFGYHEAFINPNFKLFSNQKEEVRLEPEDLEFKSGQQSEPKPQPEIEQVPQEKHAADDLSPEQIAFLQENAHAILVYGGKLPETVAKDRKRANTVIQTGEWNTDFNPTWSIVTKNEKNKKVA